VPSYLVESYCPEAPLAGERGMPDRLAGQPVRHVRATFVPSDEMFLHVIEAASIETAEQSLRDAGVIYERIVEVIE